MDYVHHTICLGFSFSINTSATLYRMDENWTRSRMDQHKNNTRIIVFQHFSNHRNIYTINRKRPYE